MEAVNVLFSCVEQLIQSNASDMKLDINLFVRKDSILLSVAKSIIEYCPNVIRALTSSYGLQKDVPPAPGAPRSARGHEGWVGRGGGLLLGGGLLMCSGGLPL